MNQKATIVSIVSEQTIPNVLFIKDYQSKAADFLFLSTKDMERKQKTQTIIDSSGIGNLPVNKIVVEEDEIKKIIGQLAELGFHKKNDHQYYVNLTGGTKLMSLAVYEYFGKLTSIFYYLPIGKNQIIELDSRFDQKIFTVQTRLNLHEYLVANGITYSQKELFSYSFPQAKQIFVAYQKTRFRYEVFPVQLAQNLSKFEEKPENVAGTWFEEYIFFRIKDELKLPDDHIAASVMIYKDKEVPYNDNEFDIMFVKENELYVIECKVNLTTGNTKQKLDVTLHKLGAISKNFGLRTSSYIFTLSNLRHHNGDLNSRLLRKCEILNVKPPVDAKSFEKGINLREIFKH
jgi:hypothetical protein